MAVQGRRDILKSLVTLTVLLVWLCCHETAVAAGRVALVIGNGAYVNANTLPNPPNDATDMTAALKKLGFTVIGGNDLDFAAMGARIGEFEDAARDADVTLFFYAGHGLQVSGRNYLVPVNAKLDRESALQFEAIDAEAVLRSMAGPGKIAIAFLDACRDNPLSRSLKRSLGKSRSTAVQQGLAVPSIVGGGMLIGFSTAPGEVAADGDGRNSPFTTALLKNLNTPGLEIQQLMTRVKADVFSMTKETQEPWHNSSLRSEVYLDGPPVVPEAVVEKKSLPEPPVASAVEMEWNAVKDTKSKAVLNAFIAAHRDSPVFVALAEDRKATLQGEETATLLDSLKIPKAPAAGAQTKAGVEKKVDLAVNEPAAPPAEKTRRGSSDLSLKAFFDLAKPANEGQTTYATLSLSTIDIPAGPVKNPGSKSPALGLTKLNSYASLDALLAAKPDVRFPYDKASNCRLDWVDRCPFLPADMLQSLGAAMAAIGLDINDHNGSYYFLTPISGTDSFVLSNAPTFKDGTVAIIAAVIDTSLTVQQLMGFELSREKLGIEAGTPESDVEVTGAASDGSNLYLSVDGSHRCTDKPRKFGFITKIALEERRVLWVSPFNTSDTNLILKENVLLSANGGSCVDDFLYAINPDNGSVTGRAKLSSAVERMSEQNGVLTLELYDSAGLYQLQ
jgi:Caspase domain